MNENLLKEVYERRKKVADQNENSGRSLPPWLQKAKNNASGEMNEKRMARKSAIQKRLASRIPQQKGK